MPEHLIDVVIDTDILVAYLTRMWDEPQGEFKEVVEAIDQGSVTIWIPDIVLLETIQILEKKLDEERLQLVFPNKKSTIKWIIESSLFHKRNIWYFSKEITLKDGVDWWRILALYVEDTEDIPITTLYKAVATYNAGKVHLNQIFSFNKDFDKLKSIRIERMTTLPTKQR